MDSAVLNQLTSQAIERLLAEMGKSSPKMTQQAAQWMASLSRTGKAADYFQHPLAFPMLLLPLWLEESLIGTVNLDLQANLVYSSVSGYYFIRMIDNVMDEQSQVEIKLLPMTAFFHAEATRSYHQYFAAEHPFWNYFLHWNALSAELAIEDQQFQSIDFATFKQIAGQKVVAGKIPLAAVLAHHQRLEKLTGWEAFYDQLSYWHQMLNDVLSWQKDINAQSVSYFLCEGQKRKAAHESLFAWLIREGFSWAFATLQDWLNDLLILAGALGSERLCLYLQARGEMLLNQEQEFKASLNALGNLMKIGSKEQ